MKHHYKSLAVLACLLSLSGCSVHISDTTSTSSSEQQSYDQQDSQQEAIASEASTSSIDNGSTDPIISIDEIGDYEKNSLYIENNGECQFLKTSDAFDSVSAFHDGSSLYSLPSGETRAPSEAFYTFSIGSGDRLLTTVDDNATACPVTFTGYFGKSEITNVDEINGTEVTDLSSMEAVLNPLGIQSYRDGWICEKKTSFIVGKYNSTDWVEDTVEISEPFFKINLVEDSFDLPLEKTKDGYFIIDCSSLTPGKWAIKSGLLMALINVE